MNSTIKVLMKTMMKLNLQNGMMMMNLKYVKDVVTYDWKLLPLIEQQKALLICEGLGFELAGEEKRNVPKINILLEKKMKIVENML